MDVTDPTAADRVPQSLPAELFADIIAISADAIVAVDEEQCIIFFNEGAERIFGYRAEEVQGKALAMLLPERHRAVHRGHVTGFGGSHERARRMGERQQISGLRKSGEEFPAEASISRVALRDRVIYTAVLRDITDRARAERQQRYLAAAGEWLAGSLDPIETAARVVQFAVPKLGDAAVLSVVGRDHVMRTFVSHVDASVARRLEQLLPTDTLLPAPPVLPAGATHEVTGVLARDASAVTLMVSDIPALHPLLELVAVRSALRVPLIARGEPIGELLCFAGSRLLDDADLALARDLARRAALAIDNARLHAAMRSAVEGRDDMLAIVSHDLRNPANAIRMLSGSILAESGDQCLPDHLLERVRVIRSAADQVEALIQDLLDMTRIEAGRLQVSPSPEDAAQLLTRTLQTLAPAAAEAGVEVGVDIREPLPMVLADADRASQVLSNVIGNAIKFTPSGGSVRILVEARDGSVIFETRDTGYGITPEHLTHVFDRFWQASHRQARAGAGLGLAIAKGIIEAHGGHIGIASQLGTGTTVTFTLPIARAGHD